MTTDAKKIFRFAVFFIFFLCIIVYTFLRTKDLVFGVKIRDVNITDRAKMDKSVIEVKGNAKNALKLSLDGREISIDQNGNFDETIALSPGYNVVTIQAEDKFGHKDEKSYKLTF